MELSTALAAQLATLGSSAVELPEAIDKLHGTLLAVVPSAVGLSITVHISEIDLTLTTLPDGVRPETSLRVPLSLWADFETGSEVVFYASTPGALVDLAAELGWALELNITWSSQVADHMLVVDQHLAPLAGMSGLDDLSAINRAVGVLLSRGRSPRNAVDDLKTAATRADSSIGAAANALLARLDRTVVRQHAELSALPARARWDGTAASGDHFCGLYRGESQRDQIMLPYLREGLRNGDQCLCLIDRTDPTIIRGRLAADAGAGDEQLDVRRASDVYLVDGDFVADTMVGFLGETAAAVADADGGRQFRATGEMSWATGGPRSFEQFFTYESELNRMTSTHAPALLCLFDLDDLDAAALDNVLRTHPTIVYDQSVIDNPNYQHPDDRLASC